MKSSNKIIVFLLLTLISLNSFANGNRRNSQNRTPIVSNGDRNTKLIEDLNREFSKKRHANLKDVFVDFTIIQHRLQTEIPDGSTAFKSGALQNHYLTLMAKIFRGSTGWGLDFAESEGFESGKASLLYLIQGMPFDQKGLDLLKAFILAYKGDEALLETQLDIIKVLKNKTATTMSYGNYEYKEITEEGTPNFKYDSFEYDPESIDFPEDFEKIRAKNRIKNFPNIMQKDLKGSKDQIERIHALLKENFINPDKKINITLLGTSGNGKTQLAKAMSIALFNDKDAYRKITFTGKTGELSDQLRSSTGYVGSSEPTAFEKWFVERIETDKGGIIVLDELLSFYGLNKEQISNKVQSINELYDLLDERVLKIGNKVYDMSKFHVIITGNALQEAFFGLQDNPDVEKELARILARITKKDIINYFNEFGIDAPKLARFGEIFVNGPLSKALTKEVSEFMLRDSLKNIDSSVKVMVDPAILDGVVARLSTIELGMREVTIGLSKIVLGPITRILFDLDGPKNIEAKLIDDVIHWFVDDKEVVLNSSVLNEVSGLEERIWAFKDDVVDPEKIRTPQFSDLDLKKETKVEKLELKITTIHEVEGHWQVDTLITGKNRAQTISNIPAGGALGFVAQKQDEEVRASVLTRILKRNMMLEAGHRAPIHRGHYATGGGNVNHKPGDIPRDDLNKIERNLDVLFTDHIFKQYTNVSEKVQSDIYRGLVRDLMRESADYVIAYGNSIGFADELVELSIKDRFLVEEVIDAYAEKKLKTLTLDHDEIFFNAINDGVKRMIKGFEELSPAEAVIRVSMLKSLIHKVYTDVKSERIFYGASEELIESITKIQQGSVDTLSSYASKRKRGCLELLKKFGKFFKK